MSDHTRRKSQGSPTALIEPRPHRKGDIRWIHLMVRIYGRTELAGNDRGAIGQEKLPIDDMDGERAAPA